MCWLSGSNSRYYINYLNKQVTNPITHTFVSGWGKVVPSWYQFVPFTHDFVKSSFWMEAIFVTVKSCYVYTSGTRLPTTVLKNLYCNYEVWRCAKKSLRYIRSWKTFNFLESRQECSCPVRSTRRVTAGVLQGRAENLVARSQHMRDTARCRYTPGTPLDAAPLLTLLNPPSQGFPFPGTSPLKAVANSTTRASSSWL